MRIVCEKCQAAYAIDDRLISARGVRAQCPRCRHLQLVTKDGSAAAPANPAGALKQPPENFLGGPPPSPATTPVSTPRVPPEAFPTGPLPAGADRASPNRPPAVMPAVAPRVAPVSERAKSGGASWDEPTATAQHPGTGSASWDQPTAAADRPGARAASWDEPTTRAQSPWEEATSRTQAPPAARGPAAPPPPASASPPAPSWDAPAPAPSAPPPRSAPSAPPPRSAPAPTASAGQPGASSRAAAPGSALSPNAGIDDSLLTGGDPSAATMGCRECGTPLTDAFDQALGICDSCRAKADAAVNGPVQPEPKGAGRSKATPPPSMAALDAALDAAVGEAAAPEPERPRPPPSQGFVMTASQDAGAGGGKGKWIALVVVLVLAGTGGAAFAFRDRLFNKGGDQQNVIPAAVEAALPAWRMAYVEISGTAPEHLAAGQKLLAEDSATAYEQAIEEFQKALILDPKSDAAIAGYVRALAQGRGVRIDEGAYQEATALITAAEKRSRRAPEVVLAHAHLLLARPGDAANAGQARALAEEVLEKTKETPLLADAHLVVGQSWQSSSSALAVESFSKALELDPTLRAALYQRALAHEVSGNFGAALADLRARLAVDPGHWASNRALARIYRDAGRLELAKQVYLSVLEKDPDHTAARLELAVFRYQAEGKLQEALGELRGMAKTLERYDEADQVELLTHLATAERLANNDNAAVDAAQRAIKIAPEDPAPHLQLFLIALKREVPTDAEKELPALTGKLGDPGLEKLLEGRLRMSEQKWAEALAAFDASVTADGRRIEARLLAGIAAASAGNANDAYQRLAEAAKADPARGPRPPSSARLYLQPVTLLKGFEDRIVKLAKSPEDLPPKLYEAVYRFHLGDAAAAARLTRQITNLDENNALALSWQAFADLAGKDVRGATKAAQRAAASNRSMALAQYALGAALLAGGKIDDARRPLQEALRLDPSLLGAEQQLAELAARRKDVDSARGRLTHILSLDPSWLPAKRLLFALEKEAPREGAGPR